MAVTSRRRAWIAIALLALLAWALYRYTDAGRWLSLQALKDGRDQLLALAAAHPAQVAAGFFALYVAVAALSLPGAAILTLAAGAIFGLPLGVVIVSFAASVGALAAFLVARYLLHDAVQQRFARQLAPVNEGMRRDGAFYLATLRLIPLFPFFFVNLVAALTPIRASQYYWVSQLGMLPATIVYVNAGTQLAAIRGTADVLSPGLLASLVLLGTFPLVARAIVATLRRRRVYARWTRPARFDRNLVVIGAGAAGLVTSYIAATVRARVTLVEAHRMGGDCLNTGCVPSKALLRSARAASAVRRAGALGVRAPHPEVDFAAVMARVHRVIARIAPNDSVERYRALGVDVVQGRATLVSPWEVEIAEATGVRRLTTRSIVIASGAQPFVPPIPGLADVALTSETIWDLDELPQRLLVLGGGPIGCELAQAFARLGAAVTLVEMAPRLMVREDDDAAALVAEALRADGVTILAGHEAVRCTRDGDERVLVVRDAAGERPIAFDALLCAVGRAARVDGLGLEALGIARGARGTIETDAWLRTTYPNIYAVGDVAGPLQLTHAASHQAWHAAVNALFGRFWRFRVDYSRIPWTTFTDPEVARVGLSEAEARERGIAFETTRFALGELDRAIADDATTGFVKVLTAPGKDRLLGVTIVAEQAGEMIAEWALAMRHGLALGKVLGTVHTYPTMAEANARVAGEWKRAHAPQRVLRWLARDHAWERGSGDLAPEGGRERPV